MGIFILVVALSLIIASTLGESRKIGYGWSLILCLLLSPFVGVLIILCFDKKKNEPIKYEEPSGCKSDNISSKSKWIDMD